MRLVLLYGIRLYQIAISPMLPRACRFYPTCSHYAAHAIAEYGALYGAWLAIARLARCNPWHPGGVDFVPSRSPDPSSAAAPGLR